MEIDFFKIIEKYNESHNSIRIVVETEKKIKNLQVSTFVLIYDDKGNFKPYTPIEKKRKSFTFVIKVYKNGVISQYINNLKKDDYLRIKFFFYKKEYNINTYKNILMLAAGTGITPMYQLLNYANENSDSTQFFLLNFNHTPDDLLLENELNELSSKLNNNQKKFLTVKNIFTRQKNEKYDTNWFIKITENKKFDFVYICGPTRFLSYFTGNKTEDKNQGELSGLLKNLNYNNNNVYKF